MGRARSAARRRDPRGSRKRNGDRDVVDLARPGHFDSERASDDAVRAVGADDVAGAHRACHRFRRSVPPRPHRLRRGAGPLGRRRPRPRASAREPAVPPPCDAAAHSGAVGLSTAACSLVGRPSLASSPRSASASVSVTSASHSTSGMPPALISSSSPHERRSSIDLVLTTVARGCVESLCLRSTTCPRLEASQRRHSGQPRRTATTSTSTS